MKYLISLLFIVSLPSYSCTVLQEKYESDGYLLAEKADKDPIIEALRVFIPASIEGYEASYSHIYLMDNDDLIISSTTSALDAPAPKSLPSENKYKAIYLNVQQKYKENVELEVHYINEKGQDDLLSCSKVRRYKLNELKSL